MDLFEYADREIGNSADETAGAPSPDEQQGAAAAPSSDTPTTAPSDLRATVSTLGDALRAVTTMPNITASRMADWRSAVASFAKVTGHDPDTMPISPVSMVPVLKAVRPGMFRMTAKRWSNVRSSLAGLAAMVGWHADRARMRMDVSGDWEDLLNLLARSPQKANLRGFARHCTVADIAPPQVDEAALEGYREWLKTETFDLHPNTAVGGVRSIWNRNAGKTPGWPERKLVAPKDPRNFALPLTDFPASFASELEGFVEMMRNPDPFDPHGSRKLAPHTCRDRRGHLIRAATILVSENVAKIEDINGLHVLVTPTAFRTVLGYKHRKAGRVWNGSAVDVAVTLLDTARRWVKVDDAALAELTKLRGSVKTATAGIGARSQRRLQGFDDPQMLKRFFRLPAELFLAADRLQAEGRLDEAARLHERALALAILQVQPLRRRALALIDTEKHLRRELRGRYVTLWLPGELQKNGVEVSAPIPDDLGRRIAKHVRVHLPLLRGGKAGAWLFPGDTEAGHKEPGTLAKGVTKEVTQALGVEFSLHMVRHIAAMVLYDSSPDAGPVAQRLLAHRQLSTTETFYGRLKTRSAHTKWSAVLDAMRAKDRKRHPGAGGGRS